MHLRDALIAAAILCVATAATGQVPQSKPQDTAAPVVPPDAVRFKVSVTADQQIVDSVYDYMMRVSRRNAARARLSAASASPELELALLVDRRIRMPQYQREIGIVRLRLDQDAGTAVIEYCREKCETSAPVMMRYSTTITAFLQRLAEATANLAKYGGR
jgi:hypothetical protein